MPLHRMDRQAMTGCIAWPVHLDSYGACGTSVYAVWPEQRPDEPMVVCCAGLSVQAVLVEEPCGPQEPWRQVFPDLDDPDMEIAERSEDLLAFVLLGTTGATWALRKPGFDPETPMHDCFDGF